METRRDGRLGRRWAVVTTAVVVACTCTAAGAADEAPRPSGSVSLQQAIDAALAYDGVLASYAFEEEARTARARQEARPPNPTLATEVENVARVGGDTDAAEAAQTTVSLAQVVELGGKRSRRAAVAERDAALAHWDVARADLETRARVRRVFVTALLAEARVGLARRRRDLAHDAVGAARRYRDAGSGSAADVARAEALFAAQHATVARRERESAAARDALAAMWGGSDDSVTGVVGSLAPLPQPVAPALLRERLASHPDLARFGDAIGRAEADVALEESRRIPNVAVRVGARRFVSAESNALVAEVSVPLPVFDRNADAIAEAHARLAKTHAERRAAATAAEAAVRAEYAELRAAFDEARTLDDVVLPRLAASVRESRRAYEAGTLRQLDVLDAERVLADTEDERLAVLARFHGAATELERLTGGPVTGGTR